MSLFEDTYQTIDLVSEGIYRDKGSKFVAYAFPFSGEQDLKALLLQLRAQHPKARHHCWAYRLTSDRQNFRVQDDGEPAGSAGRPILNVLLSRDITNVLVVVVRYFGGTLLGIPGLINAYKQATQEALDVANLVEKTVNDQYEVCFDYLQMNDVMRIIKEENLHILKQDFDLACSLTLEVRKMQVNQVVQKLENLDKIRIKYLLTL